LDGHARHAIEAIIANHLETNTSVVSKATTCYPLKDTG